MRRIIGIFCALLFAVQAFSQVTDSVLTVRANVIRNEATPGGNTRVRIANMFQDLTNSKVSLLSTYTNPTWLTSLPWSKITSTPTTLSTYGITDAVPTSRTLTINGTTYDLSANRSWTITAGVWGQISGTMSDQLDLQAGFDAKQNVLVSGTSIKTVGGTSLLGSGNIPVGTGTVTSVSVTTSNGVSGSVATATTTPAITLTLGAITPTSVNSVVVSGSSTPTLAVTGTTTVSGTHSGTSSGSNNGDQTISISGDATASGSTGVLSATVTKINGTSLAGLSTGILKNTTTTGTPSIAVAGDFPTLNQNTTGSAASLTTARTIGTLTGDATTAGSSFDGSANNANALTLATVNSNVGSFGSATTSLTTTVNAKGLITAISSQTVTPAIGSVTGLGTGVGTALGVNTGSSGAFVVNAGALGTPSSGTLTNTTISTATTGTSNTTPTNTAFVQQELTNQAVLQTGNQTVAGVKSFTSGLASAEANSTASSRGFDLTTRNVALTFPAVTVRPTTANKEIAFDVIPNGTFTENANGFAWIDVCTADIKDNNNASNSARIAATSTGAEFGSRFFNGGSATPLKLTVGIAAGGTVNAFYADATGKKTGLNTSSPNYNFDIVENLSTTSTSMQIRNGSAGTTASDGVSFGIDNAATPAAFWINRENSSSSIWTNATQAVTVNSLQKTFFGGSTSATAFVHIKAGTTSAATAPLKFTSGSNMTTAEAGAVEYDGTNFYFSPSTTRKRSVLSNDATPSNGQVPIGNGTDYTVANITGSNGVTVTNGSGTIALSGTTTIVGVSTNSSATAGNLGEEINSTISTYTNYTTTATYQNITSITLTAGDWDISAMITYNSNASTITAASNAIYVISTTTASASGAVEGQSIGYIPQAALLGTSKFTDTIAPYRVSLSGSTTYYLNTQATFTVGNPQYVGSIRARRLR